VDCIILYSETESYFSAQALANSQSIRSWLAVNYKSSFVDLFDEVDRELINFINSLDSHLDQIVHYKYLTAILKYFRFDVDCGQCYVPIAFRPRPSDLVEKIHFSSIPYVPRVFESGTLVYSNEHEINKQTGLIRIFESKNSLLMRDVVVFGSSDSYSGLIPFLTFKFKRVFFIWSDTNDGLECLKHLNISPDVDALRIVALRERFI
jgi:hypothetical protein